jgi:hypothetical protein
MSTDKKRMDPKNMNFSKEEMQLGRNVILLKRKYEEIARKWESFDEMQRDQFRKANLDPQIHPTTGKHVYAFWPDEFVFAVLGISGWGHASYRTEKEIVATVDPWIVSGGLRKKDWFNFDREQFVNLIPDLDKATRASDTGVGSFTTWLKPFPLLWANEGKNRVQQYQDANIALLTSVKHSEFLPAHSLRLSRSVYDASVWVVRYIGCGDSAWDDRVQRLIGNGPDKMVLPFPQVGVPLLQSYGVKVDRAWGLPWSLRKSAETEASIRFRKHGWS